MQLSPQETQKLESRPLLSIIIWKIGEGRAPQCILRGPGSGELPEFTIMFDKFLFDEKTSKVVTLPFSVVSSQRQFSKYGASLFYLEEPEDRDILNHFAQVTEIEVVTCRRVAQEGRKKKRFAPISIKRQGWQNRHRQEIQEILMKRHLSDTNTQSVKPQQQQENSAVQVDTTHKLDKQSLHQLPLIERCILQQQYLVQRHQRAETIGKDVFWRSLLPFALEKSCKFILEANASQMIEARRRPFNDHPQPIIPPKFPSKHLWLEFENPVETPICKNTAAIFVFSGDDSDLLKAIITREKKLPLNLQDIYRSEKDLLSLHLPNTKGDIVRAMSLPSKEQYANSTWQTWLVPAWYACIHTAISMHRDHRNGPICKLCRQAHVHFSTWLLVVWQALQGSYRERNVDETIFDRIGMEHINQSFRQKGTIQVTHRYRVLRYTDISTALKRPLPSEPLNPRGSWVEALAPDQVGYEKRKIPLMTRTLRDPRYADGNKERGTNQIEVRPHTRHIPVRTDQEKITKITAKHYPKKKGRS